MCVCACVRVCVHTLIALLHLSIRKNQVSMFVDQAATVST